MKPMNKSDIYKIAELSFGNISVMIIAYGLGKLFEDIEVAVILGFGICILAVAIYYHRKGQETEKKEKEEQRQKGIES